MTSTKSNESMLGLPFLVGKLAVGSGEEFAVKLLRLFRQMQVIVTGCPEEVSSWSLLQIFCSHGKSVQS